MTSPTTTISLVTSRFPVGPPVGRVQCGSDGRCGSVGSAQDEVQVSPAVDQHRIIIMLSTEINK